MVLGKTSWYSTIHPCRLGALIGSKGRAQLKGLVPFGCYLGAAFQVRDDIDNLAPGEGQYGKDAAGDIVEGKRTIPLLHLLARGSEAQQREVKHLMSNDCQLGREERIRRVLQLMTEFGSLEYARDVADTFARLAIKEIPGAFAEATSPKDVEYFTAMVLYLSGALRPSTEPRPRSTDNRLQCA